MNYREAISWIKQEAIISNISCRELIRRIIISYVVNQKASAKVVPIRK